MLSLSYVGALLTVAVLLSAPISAQTSARASARVEHVVVRGTGAAMEVEIQTSGAPVAPDTQAITGPDRIIVDFPAGYTPPARGSTVTRDEARPYEITEVRKQSDGQLNVFVREIMQ